MRNQALLGIAAPLLSVGSPAATAENCDRSCLLGIAGAYLDGLGAGDAKEVPFAPEHRIWVNGVETDLVSGIWTSGNGWTYRHTVVDAYAGQAVTMGVLRDGEQFAFVGVRIAQRGGRIVESEILLAREGDFSLFEPGNPHDADALFYSSLPPDQRERRETLEQIARGYFQALINSDASRTAFHPDCNRIENNVRTTNGTRPGSASCSEGIRRFGYMRAFREMRFPVVDQERGLVMGIGLIDMPLQERTITVRGRTVEISAARNHLPRTLYLFELFKVVDGRILRIEAVLRNLPHGARLPFGGDAEQGPPIPEG